MRVRWVLPLVLLITLAGFWSVFLNGFVNYDDGDFLTANPHVYHGLTLEGVRWAWTATATGVWQPLAWMALMVQAQFFGGPAGFHLVSLAIHLANTALLLGFLTSATGCRWRSVVATMIFAIHPLRVESVAWISEQRDVLSVFFALLALHAYLRWAGSARKSWFGVVLLCWILSLMTKPMLITLPAILLLLDFWPLKRLAGAGDVGRGAADPAAMRRESPRRLLLEKLPFLAGALVLAVGTMASHSVYGISPIWKSENPLARLADVAVAYVRYLGKMVWFRDLCVPYTRQSQWPAWQIAGAVVLLAAITLVSILRIRRNPWLITGWLWYVVTLVPVIGLVQFGAHSIADRYTYFSGIGLSLMLVWSLPEWSALRLPMRTGLAAAGAIALAVMFWCTTIQLSYWRNSISLFEHTLACGPDNYLAHNNLASALLGHGEYEQAIPHLRRALELYPAYPDAHAGLGLALEHQGHLDEAVQEYQAATSGPWRQPEALRHLGSLLFARGQIPQSLHCFQEVLAGDPNDGDAIYGAGLALNELGRLGEAEKYLRRAELIAPDNPQVCFNLGLVLYRSGDLGGAVARYQRALQLEPSFARGQFLLGATLMEMGKFDDAIPPLRRAVELDPLLTPARTALTQAQARARRP